MKDQKVQLISSSHHVHLLDAMWRLRMTRSLCDITVQVDFQGELEEFEVHQVVLAAASGYFKTILLAGEEVKKLFLTDIAPDIFNKFLEYVYSGKMEVEKKCLGKVLHMAKLLDCQDLVEACGTSLSDHDSKSASEICMEVRKERLTKSQKKMIDQHGSHAETERKQALQGRRSSRLAGRRVVVAFTKQKVNQTEKSQSTSPDSTLNQDEFEETQEEGLQSSQVCETESDVADHQLIPEKEALTDSGSESAYTYIHVVPEDDMQVAFIAAKTVEETDAAEKECKIVTKYNCDKCIRSFRYEKSYLKHVKISHGIQTDTTYCCKICQQKFANRCNLKIHERHVHSDERLFICGVCGKAFKRKKDVTRHMRQVHEGGTGRHYCPICGKSLSSKTALTLHKRTHTGDKPYSCEECQARFSQSSALKTHLRTHTGEKPFACDLCDARFTQNHMLAYHKRSHTGEKPFMCENCGKSFASKEYLKHHARIHSGLKPYKCEKCGRAFAQRNSLHQHMKIHTGERPYHCSDCDKQFTQLNALQRHQRIHTGEKPYMCSMCSRTFTDKSTVRRHAMTHDKDTPWKNYLVVLQGNVEGRVKKPKCSSLKKEKAAANSAEQKPAGKQSETKANETVDVQREPVTISGDWPGPGTIAVVSHGTLGNLTVIQTEISPGTQLQPIMTADGTSVISLESSTVGIPVAVPFSIPISVAHSISDSASLTVSVPFCESATTSDTILGSATSGTSVAAVTDSILDPVIVTLSTSNKCATAQLAEQVKQVEHSYSHQEIDVQPIETVETMEISAGE